jgi:hypothetical protein
VLALPLIPLIGVAAAFNTVFLVASILTALATYASSTTPAPPKVLVDFVVDAWRLEEIERSDVRVLYRPTLISSQ